jgi:hypothetical protein
VEQNEVSWSAAIGVGMCAALVGIVVGFALATAFVEWYRVPAREGTAGLVGMFIILLVVAGSIGVGILRARYIGAGGPPSFAIALGQSAAIIIAVGLALIAVCWVFADLPPKMNGHGLELEIEIRCPPEFELPEFDDADRPYATIVKISSGNSIGRGEIEVSQARRESDGLILPAILELETGEPRKLLSIRLGKRPEILFPFAFRTRPEQKDFQWSHWIEPTDPTQAAQSVPEQRFLMRYRVREIAPPLDSTESEAQELAKADASFNALTIDDPIGSWLIYTRYGNPEPRIKQAVASIRMRPAFVADMTNEILAAEPRASNDALNALEHFDPPPVELDATVRRVGVEIAAELRDFNALTMDERAKRKEESERISAKFSAWMVAAEALQGAPDISYVAELQEIATAARAGQDDFNIRMTIVRVASFYLQQWANIEPLPSDPPPR